MLTEKEKIRYSRHLLLPQIGMEGQEKLKCAKVLIIGAGGLGCPVLLYLTAAGIGNIGIVDFDKVDENNLQRQVLYNVSDIGKNKAKVAKNKLKSLNPYCNIHAIDEKINAKNILEIINDYDIICDGTDNFFTRYLVNDACYIKDKILVFASIHRFEGQISVFNYPEKNGERGPNYRDIFPIPPGKNEIPNCAEAGVIGILPGIMGSLQCNEIIKIITGVGNVLSGKLLLYNALKNSFNFFKISKDKKNPLYMTNKDKIKLNEGEFYCQSNIYEEKEITYQEFKLKKEQGENFMLIDVREEFEHEMFNIGGELLPLSLIQNNHTKVKEIINKIGKEKILVYCKSGTRSKVAIKILKEKYGLKNLINLKGGILSVKKNETLST